MSSHMDNFSANPSLGDTTGSIRNARAEARGPTDSDMAFARNAASDVLSRGGKDASQPWENPETGARGSVTPLASAYADKGRTCRDFLASYVQGKSEAWMQGAACKSARGQWEIRDLKPWRQS
jgi:surface antigen